MLATIAINLGKQLRYIRTGPQPTDIFWGRGGKMV